jgi:Restriction endonuclease
MTGDVQQIGTVPVRTAALALVRDVLAGLDQDVDGAERIDRIRLIEEIKSQAAAAQAHETAAFVAEQREQQAAAGVPAELVGRGIASQVGLARRVSPFQASRYVGWSTILTTELPNTFAALQDGRVSEWRAMLVARETIWLSREHRLQVDAELAPQLEHLGDHKVEAEAKKIAYRLDPDGYMARTRGAEKDRHVSLRPAPDTMSRLTGLLPAAQGVSAYAALRKEADARIAAGDQRGRGQIMADTLVERITGQSTVEDVAVEVNVVLDADTLVGDSDEPCHLDGYGPIPAQTARDLISGSTQAWLRRLFSRPSTGDLIAMESRRRCFPEAQRRFIQLRDQTCRTPYCDAPIRHTDHVVPKEQDGPTSVRNGQGLCAACNFAKEAPGWHARPGPNQRIVITTPTGHIYQSRPPDPPGSRPPDLASFERRLAELLLAS